MKSNTLGLNEYTRQDIFVDTTDEVRNADRFYIMIEADELFAEKDNEITALRDECAELHNRIATLLSQIKIRDERIDELYSEVEKK